MVDLSRLQFALTVLYHFLFVPLTLGLAVILAAMESVYVITGKAIYKEMTQFWGQLFAINFALGVATGLTMEFEFGTNWSMYSHFVGDVFGTPLAIEGLMAFFLESTFVGLMVFGWDRLSKPAHLAVTYLVALGSNLSALWILIANAFMQDPRGATFDPNTMRMQFTSLYDLVFSADAQAKFVHTSISGFVTGAMFVMGISAYYLLRKQHRAFAARSFRMAALVGLASTLAVITLGDALGRADYLLQNTKIAAIEDLWHTTKPPYEPWKLVALPNDATQSDTFSFSIGLPYVLTPLVTHTLTKPIQGLLEIERDARAKVARGIQAVLALHTYAQTKSAEALARFYENEDAMGYGLLAQRYAPGQDLSAITNADLPQVLQRTARATIPNVFVEFWSFRIMVALGVLFLVLFAFGTYYSLRNQLERHPILLRLSMWAIPLPVLAAEFGWIVAENGRQPWTVFGWLPTFQSASTHAVGYMLFSLIGFVVIYTCFIAAELYLMFKFARLGPPESSPKRTPEPEVSSLASDVVGYADKPWQ